MSDNKDPSYPWYPRDFSADEPVQLMSLAEEGAYRRLLDHQWLHGSVPGDMKSLAKICKNATLAEMKRIWPAIEGCFTRMEGQPPRLQNRRLERVRQERKEYRERQSASGKRGAEARWGDKQKDGDPIGEPIATPLATPVAKNGSASALALASALGTPSVPTEPGEPAGESVSGEAPHTRSSVLGLVVERLYLGRRPPESEMASNASILAQFNNKGRSWDELARIVEGLATLRDRGELTSVARTAIVSCKWLNSEKHLLNQLAVSEDAYYKPGADSGSGKRGGRVTDIRSILGKGA